MRMMIGSVIAVLAICGGVLAFGVSTADAASQDRYSKWCRYDTYNSVKGLRVAKKPKAGCSIAYKVLDKWMDNDNCWERCNIRVGGLGWLWKCSGYRDYGQLRRWSIDCWSAKEFSVVYHHPHGGQLSVLDGPLGVVHLRRLATSESDGSGHPRVFRCRQATGWINQRRKT